MPEGKSQPKIERWAKVIAEGAGRFTGCDSSEEFLLGAAQLRNLFSELKSAAAYRVACEIEGRDER